MNDREGEVKVHVIVSEDKEESMPKGKGYAKKKSTTTTTVKPKKKKTAIDKIRDRARKNKDALNFE